MWDRVLPTVLFILTAAQTSAPITGAKVSVMEKAVSEVHVTLENHRDSAIIEYRVSSSWAYSSGKQRIAPHERGTISIPIENSRPGPVDGVTAATVVAVETVPVKSYSVLLENLRDVPLEAYKVETVDAAGKPRMSLSQDFCTADAGADGSGNGRLRPHETRELRQVFGPEIPVIRVSYVLFDDLVFQGDPADRDRLFQRRQDRADEYPMALATLDEATKKTPAELEPFLLEKVADRFRQIQQRGTVQPFDGPLDSMLREVRRAPEQFLANADSTRTRMEQEYQRLTRHLRAPVK